jgi:hypothetical protein
MMANSPFKEVMSSSDFIPIYPEGKGIMKLLTCLLGLTLACYGSVEIWLHTLNVDAPAKRRICSVGLCPEEFSPERVYELEQLSNGEYSSYAVQELKRALRLNSASAYAWADLGEAETNVKNLAAARYCFQRSLALGPGNPVILFRAANFDFQAGDDAGTLRNLVTILRNPELLSYYEQVFLTYSRMNLPIERILDQGIPATSIAADAFLRYWINSNNLTQAAAVWKWLPEHAPADDKLAGEYVAFLIRNKSEIEAAETWKAFTASQMPDYRRTNFLYNGEFEQTPKPSPLDWGLDSVRDVRVGRVQSEAHEGDWSLRLLFEGLENVDFHQAVQDVVLEPGRWQFRAFLKTEQITTDQGVALHLFDTEDPSRLDLNFDTFTGSHPWTQLERTFEVGPDTKMVRVELMRQASTKFDNKITGSAWLDSVEISPIH